MIQSLNMQLEQLNETEQFQKHENKRRRHNYIPFIVNLLAEILKK